MEKVAGDFGLLNVQPRNSDIYTCTTLRNGKKTQSTIDYILSNRNLTNVDTLAAPEGARLDHKALLASVQVLKSDLTQKPNPKVRKERMLKKDANTKDVLTILKHNDWPRRPFNMIANTLGKTTVRYLNPKHENTQAEKVTIL
jgi:hypothetical protein